MFRFPGIDGVQVLSTRDAIRRLYSILMRFQLNLGTSFIAIAALSSFCFGSMIFSSISQDSLYIGYRLHFGVTLVVPKASQVTPPPTDNGFGKAVVKEWTSDKVEKRSADSIAFHYAITTYSAEPCTIPSLDFFVTKENAAETLHTQAFPLHVLLVSSPDTASIKDLKPQQSVGKPSLLWLWLLLAGAASVAGFLFVRRCVPKRGLGTVRTPPKPPYEEAMEALDRLEAKHYVAQGMIREYVFELSEIAKRYIERRFEVQAAEFTTEELLEWAKRSPLQPAERKTAEWFFSTTDPVKFAKWLPDNDTVYRFGADIRTFVEKTRPQAPQEAQKVQGGSHAS